MWGTEKETQPLPQGIYNKNIAVLCQNITAIEMCARSAKGFASILAERQSCSSDYDLVPLPLLQITFQNPSLRILVVNRSVSSDVPFSKQTKSENTKENIVRGKTLAVCAYLRCKSQHEQPGTQRSSRYCSGSSCLEQDLSNKFWSSQKSCISWFKVMEPFIERVQ